jgi:hypothetical protein
MPERDCDLLAIDLLNAKGARTEGRSRAGVHQSGVASIAVGSARHRRVVIDAFQARAKDTVGSDLLSLARQECAAAAGPTNSSVARSRTF